MLDRGILGDDGDALLHAFFCPIELDVFAAFPHGGGADDGAEIDLQN
jgi:hypothetical protein